MSGEQSSLCLCVSLELLMTRQAATAAKRNPQENSTWLIKQNASFWYCWSPQTGRVSQSWAVLRTADSTKLAQQKAHSGSGVDNLLSVFQITLTLSNALPTPWRSRCYSRLSAWQPGHLQPCNWWNQTVKCRMLQVTLQVLQTLKHGRSWWVVGPKAWNCACSTTEKKGREPLEICMWNESFCLMSNSGQHQVS